jgi:SAM-dependent methyltransferase
MPHIEVTADHSAGPREPAQTDVLAELKHAARTTWALGDYAAIAERELWPLGEHVVARSGIRPGEDVLDVGCGTGNAAIRAARAGGRVVGLDLTPELFEPGRRLAADAGADVEWVEGDAEELPFDDASFDVVVSVLGVMFAPRHQVAADELVRVLRPGGRLILCNWAHDGAMSRIFGAVARYLPPPPAFAAPPARWGAEEHVRDLFAGTPIDLEFERGVHEFPPFDSAEASIEFHTTPATSADSSAARHEPRAPMGLKPAPPRRRRQRGGPLLNTFDPDRRVPRVGELLTWRVAHCVARCEDTWSEREVALPRCVKAASFMPQAMPTACPGNGARARPPARPRSARQDRSDRWGSPAGRPARRSGSRR